MEYSINVDYNKLGKLRDELNRYNGTAFEDRTDNREMMDSVKVAQCGKTCYYVDLVPEWALASKKEIEETSLDDLATSFEEYYEYHDNRGNQEKFLSNLCLLGVRRIPGESHDNCTDVPSLIKVIRESINSELDALENI